MLLLKGMLLFPIRLTSASTKFGSKSFRLPVYIKEILLLVLLKEFAQIK